MKFTAKCLVFLFAVFALMVGVTAYAEVSKCKCDGPGGLPGCEAYCDGTKACCGCGLITDVCTCCQPDLICESGSFMGFGYASCKPC
jgi:hypothetical protein